MSEFEGVDFLGLQSGKRKWGKMWIDPFPFTLVLVFDDRSNEEYVHTSADMKVGGPEVVHAVAPGCWGRAWGTGVRFYAPPLPNAPSPSPSPPPLPLLPTPTPAEDVDQYERRAASRGRKGPPRGPALIRDPGQRISFPAPTRGGPLGMWWAPPLRTIQHHWFSLVNTTSSHSSTPRH